MVLKICKQLIPYKVRPDNICPTRLPTKAADYVTLILTCTMIKNDSYEIGKIHVYTIDLEISKHLPDLKDVDAVNYCPAQNHVTHCDQLMTHTNCNKIFNPLQHGFRRGLQYETQILEFLKRRFFQFG
jgi:hypothetical protein